MELVILFLQRFYFLIFMGGGSSHKFQICPGLNANEIQIPYYKHHKVSSLVKKAPKHTQFCQIWSNMKMSDNPTKYEVLIEQYLRSILDITDKFRDARWGREKNFWWRWGGVHHIEKWLLVSMKSHHPMKHERSLRGIFTAFRSIRVTFFHQQINKGNLYLQPINQVCLLVKLHVSRIFPVLFLGQRL